MNTIQEYYDALDRLRANKPINIPIGTKITNDAVSLEAGHKKGTIKKSRPQFTELIAEIELAENKLKAPIQDCKIQIEKYKAKYKEQKVLYEQSLNRELMYLETINKLGKRLPSLRQINNT